MRDKFEFIHFFPLQGKLGVEGSITKEVFAKVDTGPTRGGQVTGQAFYRHQLGRFIWAIAYNTFGGSWYENNTAGTRETLAYFGAVYANHTFTVLNTAMADEAHSMPPLGKAGATVRAYESAPHHSHSPEAFEQAMVEEILPSIALHTPNRLGHSTDAFAFLKIDIPESGVNDPAHYGLIISRSVHESFQNQDTFPGDIRPALEKMNGVGEIFGLNDYEVIGAEWVT